MFGYDIGISGICILLIVLVLVLHMVTVVDGVINKILIFTKDAIKLLQETAFCDRIYMI